MNTQQRPKGKKPISRSGSQTRCRKCGSWNHWERDCPDKHLSDVTFTLNEVVLHVNDSTLKDHLAETWSCAILDCGATNCGKIWFDEYIASLNPDDQAKVRYSTSNHAFRFGDGKIYKSSKLAFIPAFISDIPVTIQQT